jgi:uncharacterized membrane protein YfcA
MTILQAIILFLAAIVGGTLNAVAGGGSFVTFPTLVFTGVLPIQANATSTVALWPGSLASIGAYRRELGALNRTIVVILGVTSLVGGALGAALLLLTPQQTFVGLIPFLLLLATLLFAFSPRITATLRKRTEKAASQAQTTQKNGIAQEYPAAGSRGFGKTAVISRRALIIFVFVQFLLAIYGGYFGGGLGIMMLAALGIMGMENIHEMNGLKTILQASINGIAVVTFIVAGAVYWPQALVMIAGAIVGGFGSAYYARKIDPRYVRGFVIIVGVGMTIYFFLHSLKVV